MPVALIVGPAVALIGIVAVVFVMRHKSVEKHSMYSARRSQIEHKVRAARQRTLTPHGHEEKPAAPGGAEGMPPPPPPTFAPYSAPPTFAPTAAPPTFSYEPSAYQPPPPAAPAQESTPWEVGPAEPEQQAAPPPPPPSAPSYDYPPAEPAQSYAAAPPSADQAWTPAPAQAEPLPPAEPVLTSTPAGSGASWSIVGEAKDSAAEPAHGDKKKSKKEKAAQSGSWQLASGNAPGSEADEEVKKPSATMAIAQYAVLVVGLVMVLIGVLVMVANSHTT
jgi:hypothetical protein